MNTIKFYVQARYMGFEKNSPTHMPEVISWLNSDKQKHNVIINGTRFYAYHMAGVIKAISKG